MCVCVRACVCACVCIDVCFTSEQVYGRVSHGQRHRFGAGDSCTAAGHVLGADAEQTAALLRQNVLTVAQERVISSVKRDVVRVTGGHAEARTQRLTAVPALLTTHTVNGNNSFIYDSNMHLQKHWSFHIISKASFQCCVVLVTIGFQCMNKNK